MVRRNKYHRRDFLRDLTLGLGAGIAASSLPGCFSLVQGANKKKPNILFIFSDDHACQAIGAYGSRINQTPNIDRIANEGAVLLHNTCCNSICAPSRAAILTGKHSHLNGQKSNNERFDGSQQTFPKLMQKAGYQTAMIGKWHLGSDPTGFDYWDILPGQGDYYNPDFISPQGKRRIEGYNTDIITDLALDWLKEQQRTDDRPFMLMCQYKAPHRSWLPGPDHLTMYNDVDIPEPETLFDDYSSRTSSIGKNEMTISKHLLMAYDLQVYPGGDSDKPYDDRWYKGNYDRMTDQQKKKWDDAYNPPNEAFRKANLKGDDLVRWKYQRYIKNYLRCIASLDDNIGRLLDYLDKSGLAQDTIVIYSSDQGFYLGEHNMFDKRWMYEESLSMPFVIRWPGVIKPGTKIESLTQNIDFGPTFLEMAGHAVPDDMQGCSFVPLLKGKKPGNWRKSIYYHYYETGEHNVAKHEGVRTERYKLIHFYGVDEWEFYDLQTDPRELHNRYDDMSYAAVIEQLKAELARLKKQYGVSS